MLGASVPAKFQIIWGASAGAGFIRTIPGPSQIGVQAGAASLTDGFPPVTFLPIGSGGTPPWGQDFNGILKQITSWNQWQAAGGPIPHDPAFATAVGGYPSGATIATDGPLIGQQWISLVDNNSSDPDTGGANWQNQNPWNNNRVAVNGTLTVSNIHDATTLDLGGGSFYAVTFPAAASLYSNFKCVILNTESSVIAKGISGIGNSFLLYPGQSYLVYNNNGTLRLLANAGAPQTGGVPIRYSTTSVSLFVDGTNGSNNPLVADGLASGTRAYKTIGAAINALYNNFDHNKSFPTITVAAGTYAESITVTGQMFNTGVFFINGASSLAATWTPAGAGTPYCLLMSDMAVAEISNIQFDGAAITSTAIQMHQACILDMNSGCGFGSHGTPGGNHVAFDGAGATFNLNASYAVNGVGGAGVHLSLPSVGMINHSGSITVTITNSPNIGIWFRPFGSGSTISLGSSITWTGSLLAGGQKWSCGNLALLALNGNSANVPGSVAGTPATGNTPIATGVGMVIA